MAGFWFLVLSFTCCVFLDMPHTLALSELSLLHNTVLTMCEYHGLPFNNVSWLLEEPWQELCVAPNAEELSHISKGPSCTGTYKQVSIRVGFLSSGGS